MTFKYGRLENQASERFITPFFTPAPPKMNGRFDIELEGICIGKVDISTFDHETYVSILLKDTFLTIEQMSGLMKSLRINFGLSEKQRISIQQL